MLRNVQLVAMMLLALGLVGCGGPKTMKVGDKSCPVVMLSQAGLVKFVDNTGNYKGKVVVAPLRFNGVDGLRVGGICPFKGLGKDDKGSYTHFDMKIIVKPHLIGAKYNALDELPNVKSGDEVLVTFLCDEGDINSGNFALAVERGR